MAGDIGVMVVSTDPGGTMGGIRVVVVGADLITLVSRYGPNSTPG